MYGRVVRRVLQRLRPDQRVWLIVDESGHSDVVRTLVAALWYRGRALPLAWVLWPAQQPHPQAYWDRLPDPAGAGGGHPAGGQSVTVLADRAFGCPAFTDLVAAHGWQ
jgi:hypothetical protein